MGYEETVKSLAAEKAKLHAVLSKAQENRAARLEGLVNGARLKGVNEWLEWLEKLEQVFAKDAEVADVAFLIKRIRLDYEVAIEAALTGMVAVVLDTMRDVMEIWMLLRDFANEPRRIQQWLAASDKELFKEYSPIQLRRREAARRGVEVGALPETSDYKGHSRALHVSPRAHPWEAKGIAPAGGGDPWVADMAFWEMFGHARSIYVVIEDLLTAINTLADETKAVARAKLPLVEDAFERTQQMQTMFLALLQAAQQSSDHDPDETSAKA